MTNEDSFFITELDIAHDPSDQFPNPVPCKLRLTRSRWGLWVTAFNKDNTQVADIQIDYRYNCLKVHTYAEGPEPTDSITIIEDVSTYTPPEDAE